MQNRFCVAPRQVTKINNSRNAWKLWNDNFCEGKEIILAHEYLFIAVLTWREQPPHSFSGARNFGKRFVMSPNFVFSQRANEYNVKFSPSSRVGVYFSLIMWGDTASDTELRVSRPRHEDWRGKLAPMICTTWAHELAMWRHWTDTHTTGRWLKRSDKCMFGHIDSPGNPRKMSLKASTFRLSPGLSVPRWPTLFWFMETISSQGWGVGSDHTGLWEKLLGQNDAMWDQRWSQILNSWQGSSPSCRNEPAGFMAFSRTLTCGSDGFCGWPTTKPVYMCLISPMIFRWWMGSRYDGKIQVLDDACWNAYWRRAHSHIKRQWQLRICLGNISRRENHSRCLQDHSWR